MNFPFSLHHNIVRHFVRYLTILVLFMNFFAHAAPRDSEWEAVKAARYKGLPKTAITNLDVIISGAMKEKAYAEAVKAIGEKIELEGQVEGNKPEEKITRMQARIETAPSEMKPLMETILAHWYWQYYQQNRWRFLQRTRTVSQPAGDFTTWDLPRIMAEISRHFQTALAADKWLKETPVESWGDLLDKGTMADAYRPTLYDFVVYEALTFYTAADHNGLPAEENEFELRADSPVLGSAEEFMAWRPETKGATNAPELQAIRLYQDLIRFHQKDAHSEFAFASVDLERLKWGWNAAIGDEKDSRYKRGLDAFIERFGSAEISAMGLYEKARLLQHEQDLVAAHETAMKGAARPSLPQGRESLRNLSPGAKLCRNLMAEIEAKSVEIATERVWNAPWPDIDVHYRNITKVYFRAFRYDWESLLEKRRGRPEYLDEKQKNEMLARKAEFEWSEELPATSDYRERAAKAKAPDKLKAGFYFVVASANADFSAKDNVLSMASVWVSELALITRERDGKAEGMLLDAKSGEPIENATISVWHMDQSGGYSKDPDLMTDANGCFEFTPELRKQYLFKASHKGNEVATASDIVIWYRPEKTVPSASTVLFTDRAIYRPGQMIQYKGICLWADQEKDVYNTLTGEKVVVVFRDVNGKEIARQEQRANDFGSFSGSFTAPRDRLMGQMQIVAEGRANGQTYFRVEEYKRPKFEVTMDSPKSAPRLNDVVRLKGQATAYTGAAVDGARLKYRVVRTAQMPWWWGWYGRPWHFGDAQEIAQGTLATDVEGAFRIEFSAKPDSRIPQSDDPIFSFGVHVDVTDSAGETHSDVKSVRVGYTAIEARLSADEWETTEKPVEVRLETKSHDGEAQAAEGIVRVYALKQPAQVHRVQLPEMRYRWNGAGESSEVDESNPNSWAPGPVVAEKTFTTTTNETNGSEAGIAKLTFKLKAGAYRAVVETQDRFGKKATGKLPLTVVDPRKKHFASKVPNYIGAPSWQVEPGTNFMALWGTGYAQGRAFVEIEHRGKMIQRYWTRTGATQQRINVAVSESMRGGFMVHVTQIRENRAYVETHRIDVPWSNKELEVKWEHFVSKLKPDQKETWTAVVSKRLKDPKGKDSKSIEHWAAEMVATLYDESLDAFAKLQWPGLHPFRQDSSWFQWQFQNHEEDFQYVMGSWDQRQVPVIIAYRSFPPEIIGYNPFYGRYAYDPYAFDKDAGVAFGARGETRKMITGLAMAKSTGGGMTGAPMLAEDLSAGEVASRLEAPASPPIHQPTTSPGQSLKGIVARKNLNETAFFYPRLTTDSNGVVRITFTMPEALTRWRFVGFAHDTDLRSGLFEDHAVTSKELMVQPNAPRFLREGDTLEFTVKVSNQSSEAQSGTVRLNFSDVLTEKSADALIGNEKTDHAFSIPAKQSRGFSWRIHIPKGCGFLTYKAVAAGQNVSDGEEGAIPVLSRRILVTESMTLPIRGPATKSFEFTNLLKAAQSGSLESKSLTVQMVSNPAWYAVLALPYLMDYPYECSEQTFNRLYANALARHIANSDPKIHRIFDLWRNTPALESPLEKNQDLKSVTLEETPWVREAESESQARKNLGILFDDNRMNSEIARITARLRESQLPDGGWSWFPGGQRNDYITLYITTGFGRLRHLGVDIDVNAAIRALEGMDAWMAAKYRDIQRGPHPELYVLSATDAMYLYGRSFFLKDRPIGSENKKAVEFFIVQAKKFWLKTGNRQSQAQIAIALKRFDSEDKTPGAIVDSLRERSVSNDEMGMFWRDTEYSWWWYRAPIETQALMIEAFDEIAHDDKAVEDCKVWLLKQKQTQNWKTTKATADAVYALLLRGAKLLASDELVQVTIGGTNITPPSAQLAEAGTGFYEKKFSGPEIKPAMGETSVKKVDAGVAWGSVSWQYIGDVDKVTPHEGTPLKLRKTLFTKINTSKGPELQPVHGEVHVGDDLVVRIELRTDRDMEFIHMKDQRGSGTEPMNVLSQYKYQDGLAYYESTRDTATHFFVDYLPKGVYVFEYEVRVVHQGDYQSGIAEIQCMYAPEFNSHSESFEIQAVAADVGRRK
jgi:uncharacterized protein YfaS (alpha-2-macroglobulin family)